MEKELTPESSGFYHDKWVWYFPYLQTSQVCNHCKSSLATGPKFTTMINHGKGQEYKDFCSYSCVTTWIDNTPVAQG